MTIVVFVDPMSSNHQTLKLKLFLVVSGHQSSVFLFRARLMLFLSIISTTSISIHTLEVGFDVWALLWQTVGVLPSFYAWWDFVCVLVTFNMWLLYLGSSLLSEFWDVPVLNNMASSNVINLLVPHCDLRTIWHLKLLCYFHTTTWGGKSIIWGTNRLYLQLQVGSHQLHLRI